MKIIRLFIWNAKIRIQRNMAYRVDFLVGMIVSLAEASIGPLFQYLLFTNTKGYPGWTIDQVILLQGLVLLFLGIRGLLFGAIGGRVANMVWRGEFDRLLTLPYKPLRSIMASGFDLTQGGVLAVGMYLTIYAGVKLQLHIGPIQILLALLGFSCGIVLYLGFMIFYCTVMVMVTKIGRIEEVINTLFNFISYPAEIFTHTLRTVLMTVLPFMVIVYFPTQVLLSRATMAVIPGILVCFGVFLLSFAYWNQMLKKYTSAGG